MNITSSLSTAYHATVSCLGSAQDYCLSTQAKAVSLATKAVNLTAKYSNTATAGALAIAGTIAYSNIQYLDELAYSYFPESRLALSDYLKEIYIASPQKADILTSFGYELPAPPPPSFLSLDWLLSFVASDTPELPQASLIENALKVISASSSLLFNHVTSCPVQFTAIACLGVFVASRSGKKPGLQSAFQLSALQVFFSSFGFFYGLAAFSIFKAYLDNGLASGTNKALNLIMIRSLLSVGSHYLGSGAVFALMLFGPLLLKPFRSQSDPIPQATSVKVGAS